MANILIVDDERDIVSALKIYLSSEDYRLFTASTGREALDCVKANDTDLGLASYFFGHDARDIAKAFETLETGDVYINGANGGSHTPHIGMKQSGIGCDQSRWSLEEYFQLKRVSLVP